MLIRVSPDQGVLVSVMIIIVSNAYNYGRRLKTLKGFTSCEYICKTWTKELQKFILNPIYQMWH